jgi:transcriptional regulator with XRE-family HTH domain
MQTTTAPKQIPTPPLRAVREARGLGLRAVAARAGLDPAHLSRVERGQSSLSVDALCRLAKVLGLRELDKLLTPYARDDRDGGRREAA